MSTHVCSNVHNQLDKQLMKEMARMDKNKQLIAKDQLPGAKKTGIPWDTGKKK